LHGEGVEIQQPARCGRAVLGRDVVEAVVAEDFGVRVEERSLELDGPAQLADVGQVRTQSRAVAADTMARRAGALAFKERFTPNRVADSRHTLFRRSHGPQVRDDAFRLLL